MKAQIFFSPDTEKGSGSSEPVKRLAGRYGIPEKDVEALLYGSRAPKSKASGSDMKVKPMAEEFRPNFSVPPPRERGWSPLNVISAIVGIMGILALVIILVAVVKRHDFDHHMMGGMPPPPMMVPPNPPHQAMQDTSAAQKGLTMTDKPDDVPPPAETNEMAKETPKKKHSSASRAPSGFNTTNSMEAQEHLAELRADGNSKAKIQQRTKNGITVYKVK